jgi:hypothetical protein
LLEAEDETLTNNIRSSPILLSLIKQLSAAAPGSQDGSPRRGSISDDEDGGSTGESGASEIAALARRILDLTDGGSVTEGLSNGRNGKSENQPFSVVSSNAELTKARMQMPTRCFID